MVVEEGIDIQRERLIGVALGSVVVKRREKIVSGGRVEAPSLRLQFILKDVWEVGVRLQRRSGGGGGGGGGGGQGGDLAEHV